MYKSPDYESISGFRPSLEERMFSATPIRAVPIAALFVSLLWVATAAQNAGSVVAAASKAMGADNLTSITFSGSARNGQFGQSKAIGDPMGTVNVTQVTNYTRTVSFAPASSPTALVSRATGTTQPPAVPGTPAPMPGQFNQNITGMQAGKIGRASCRARRESR